MANNELQQTGISGEFKSFGFVTNEARRGVFTFFIAALALLLFISVSLNIWQVKTNSAREDAANKIIREQALEMGLLRARLDTTINR